MEPLTPRTMPALRPSLSLSVGFALLVCGGLFALNLTQTASADASAQQLAITLAETTFGNYDNRALVRSAHPNLLSARPASSLASDVTTLAQRLGSLISIDSIRGAAKVPLLPLGGRASTASYSLDLQFDSAPATLFISMTREEDGWLVTDFTVDSQLLYQ